MGRTNASISTSDDTQQFVELGGRRYSHVIDPLTGMALTNRIGITVVAPSATTTDALDTSLSVLGVERALKLVESLPGVGVLLGTMDERGVKKLVESARFGIIAPNGT